MTNLAIRVLAGILLLILWTPTQLYVQSTKLSAAYSAESSWSLATWVAHRGHSRDKTQKNFAVNVLKNYMRISDPEILEEAYQYALRFIQPRPFPTLEETKAVLDELKRPEAKPERFVDLSLMQELDKEKFFDKLKRAAASVYLPTIVLYPRAGPRGPGRPHSA